MSDEDVPCKPHPAAPHGFRRSDSYSLGRYVCECEYWSPPVSSLSPLTDEQIIDAYCKVADGTEWAIGELKHAMPFARAIERAHGIGDKL